MVAGSVRKRCRSCRKAGAGTRGVLEWCPDCGGELVVIPYRQRPRRKRPDPYKPA